LVASKLEVIGTCTEAGAGFAADAYARVHGLGAICVTYCVGGFNALNAVAGAYAEKSPLVVISGAPGIGERGKSALLHHRVRDFETQLRIFKQVTAASAALEDPETAPEEIDAVLSTCIRKKRPVYLELPRDMVHAPCDAPAKFENKRKMSDPNVLAEALEETVSLVRKAKRPVILAGVEVHRFGLQDTVLKIAERTGFPIAATLLGKSVIKETHPQYLGVYEGAMGQEHVRRAVEGADCVLMLGAFMTDINLGIYTADLDPALTINATSERISVKYHHYEDITFKDFLEGLTKTSLGAKHKLANLPKAKPKPFQAKHGQKVTVKRFFQRMNEYLEGNSVVICDIGDSLFGAADLTIHRRTEFLSPAYYTSMGFAVPAALGAQIGNRKLRPIVFVGDGAFQMTGQELSPIARYGLNPIVFVLNNKGYTTERFINEGPYNDIHDWAFHLWPDLLRAGWGREVRTEGELEEALEKAKANKKSFSIINLHLDPLDKSEALDRLGKRLSKRVS
jgi:indolepyruvate decarboxylase